MIIIIGNIIALVASILMAYSGIIKNKQKVIFVQSIQICLIGISDLVLGGISGAIVNFVSLIRNVICYKNKLGFKEKIIFSILTIILTIYFNTEGILGLIILIDTVIYIWFMTIKDVKKFKYLIIFTMIPWCIYDFSIKSYTACIFDVFTIITNIIAIVKIRKVIK